MSDEPDLVPSLQGITHDSSVWPDNGEIRNKDFKHADIYKVGALGTTFINCDFSFSTLRYAYFRNAKFKNCRFIGCWFEKSNLAGATFEQCEFMYAHFSQTVISNPHEIVYQTQLKAPNLRKKLAESLRLNAISLGDAENALACAEIIVEETGIFLYEACVAKEEHYRTKYPGWTHRATFGVRLFSHKIGNFIWGHGLRPRKVLIFASVLAVLWTAILTVQNWSAENVGAIPQIFLSTLLLMLGITVSNSPFTAPTLVAVLASLSGYLAFGLLVVAATKRYGTD